MPSRVSTVTSRCSTEAAKCRIMQTTLHYSPGTQFFWCRLGKTEMGSHSMEVPMQTGYVKIGKLWQITRCNLKTSTVTSTVNLVRLQVYHTERPPVFAAHLPWYSASCTFVSDSGYLLIVLAILLNWQLTVNSYIISDKNVHQWHVLQLNSAGKLCHTI